MDKALLVGINAYPGSPLQGCLNDVRDMAGLLSQSYGFMPNEVRLLVDGEATRDNIVQGLTDLVSTASSGDRILFHYSGHGTQMPGSSGTVLDAICPVDFDFTLRHAVTALDFSGIFSAIPEGVLFNWLSDSCYSGNLTRLLLPPHAASRYLPPPADVQAQIDQRLRVPQPRLFSFRTSSPLHGAFISGCAANETVCRC